MDLILAACSGRGTFSLAPSGQAAVFENADSSGLSKLIPDAFDRVIEGRAHELQNLVCIEGPGAFTGLRMAGAFMQGLSVSLHIPLFGMSAFDIYQRPLSIPLRHLKAKSLSPTEYLTQGFEILRLTGPRVAVSTGELFEGDLFLGFQDRPLWPESEELLHAWTRAKANPKPYEIFYGLDPKIFGQRTKSDPTGPR